MSNQKSLQEVVRVLAARFAADLVGAIRDAPVGDFMALLGSSVGLTREAPSKKHERGRGRRHGRTRRPWRGERRFKLKTVPSQAKVTAKSLASAHRLQRRTKEEIEELVEEIASIVRSRPDGITAEVLRGQLKIDRRELPIPLKLALESGKIRKLGHRRSTTYLAA